MKILKNIFHNYFPLFVSAIEIPSMPNTTVPKPQPTRTMPSESNSKFKGTNSYHFDDMEIQQNRIYSTKETHLEHKTDGNKLITDTSMNYTPTQAINWNDDHDDDGRFAEVDDLDPFEVFFSGKMKFGTKNSTVVTGQIGGMAYLPCIVHNIGDSVVSTLILGVFLRITSSSVFFSGFSYKNVPGILDTEKGVSFIDSGHNHIHSRRTIWCNPSEAFRSKCRLGATTNGEILSNQACLLSYLLT